MDFKYKINGIEFEQKELTFEEDGLFLELVKDKLPFLESMENTPILETIKEIVSSDIVVPVLKLILKEKKTLKNKAVKLLHNIKVEDCYKKVPNSVLVQIFKDFFLLNLSWIGEFMNLKQG